jgi:hypothetical protein
MDFIQSTDSTCRHLSAPGAQVRRVGERLTKSSHEIAELTGKDHKIDLADIRKMLVALGIQPADFSARHKREDAERAGVPFFF